MSTALDAFFMNWGDAIILLSAAITLIGVAFIMLKNNAETSRAAEPKAIFAEDAAISAKLDILLDRTADSKALLLSLQKLVSGIDHRLIVVEAARNVQTAYLSEAPKRLAANAENLKRFVDGFSRLADVNTKLRQENEKLLQRLEFYEQEQ